MSRGALVKPGIVYGLTAALLMTLSVLGLAIAALRVAGTHPGDPIEAEVILPLLAFVQLPIWWGFLRLARGRRTAVAQVVREGELVEGAVITSSAMKRSGLCRIALADVPVERFLITALHGPDAELTKIPVLVRPGSRKALVYGGDRRMYLCKVHEQRRGFDGLPRASATRTGL